MLRKSFIFSCSRRVSDKRRDRGDFERALISEMSADFTTRWSLRCCLKSCGRGDHVISGTDVIRRLPESHLGSWGQTKPQQLGLTSANTEQSMGKQANKKAAFIPSGQTLC